MVGCKIIEKISSYGAFFYLDQMILLPSLFWLFTFYISKRISNAKVAETILSTIHATIIILSATHFYPRSIATIYYLSNTYYIIDGILYSMFIGGTMSMPFIFHHMVSITALSFLGISDIIDDHIVTGLLLAELSNIPMYITYFLLQLKKITKSNILKYTIFLLTIIEALSFTILRLVIGSYQLFNMYKELPIVLITMGILIQIVTIVWCHKLWYQVIALFSTKKID